MRTQLPSNVRAAQIEILAFTIEWLSFYFFLYITKTHVFQVPSCITDRLLLMTKNLVILSSGVAVGSGWQSTVAYINIGSYYIIGIPMGVLLGWLFNLGVPVPTEPCAHRLCCALLLPLINMTIDQIDLTFSFQNLCRGSGRA